MNIKQKNRLPDLYSLTSDLQGQCPSRGCRLTVPLLYRWFSCPSSAPAPLTHTQQPLDMVLEVKSIFHVSFTLQLLKPRPQAPAAAIDGCCRTAGPAQANKLGVSGGHRSLLFLGVLLKLRVSDWLFCFLWVIPLKCMLSPLSRKLT